MNIENISRYRIVAELASGAMGTVYHAHDNELDRSVALKVLPPDFANDREALARFRQEARAIAAVEHPNIVVVHSVEEVGDTHFITMELVRGCTLAQAMENGDFDLAAFFNLALPLAGALEAAHAQGVVHRDLKPVNIMLSESGLVKVLDFGLAKMPGATPSGDLTEARTETLLPDDLIVGTPHYMSPEQASGEPADNRSDLFAAGAIFHHVLTREPPFRGRTVPEILASVLRDTPPTATALNTDCPPALAQVVSRCLEKNPRRRYQSATDLRLQLELVRDSIARNGESAIRSIAVLPFTDMSPDQDQEHFCAGIAEEIINALTGIDRLKVVSRMSSFQYRTLGGDIREIGQRLGAQTLLEGSVRLAGNHLRIIAQLIDVADGCHIWSQRFDSEFSDIFAVQDEIAQSIVKALRLQIDADREQNLIAVGTDNPVAYDFYLRGREFFRRWGKRNVEIARRMFEQATETDPAFSAAWAGLADTFSYMYMYLDSSRDNLDRADCFSREALDLDPADAEAHASRGLALSLRRNHEAASQRFATALELDPKNFEACYFMARDLVVQGRYEEAVEFYARAHAVSPDDYQIPVLQAQVYNALGRPRAEEQANRQGLELAERAILANPEDARACYMGAGAMIRLGQEKRGLQWAHRALALDPDDPAILYNVACNFAGLGRSEQAIDCLERTVRLGAAYRDWMLNDTDLDPLRENAQFQALVESLDEVEAGRGERI